MAQSNGKRDVRRPKSKEKKFELSKKEKTIEHIQAKVVAIQKGEGDTSFKIKEFKNKLIKRASSISITIFHSLPYFKIIKQNYKKEKYIKKSKIK